MIRKKLNEKQGMRVNNVGQCTNFGSLDIAGRKMFTIKTKKTNDVSAISVYPDYEKAKRINHKFKNCLNHGNDLAYYNGKLYIAPCDYFCGVVDTDTWGFQRLECTIQISGIAHYKNKKFIALSEAWGDSYKLSIVKPFGNQLSILDTWIVSNPMANSGYTTSQSITYNADQKEVYVVFTNIDGRSNVILRSGIRATKPDYCLTSKHSTCGLYELEGIAFDNKGIMVLGSNLPSGKDSIFTSEVFRYPSVSMEMI